LKNKNRKKSKISSSFFSLIFPVSKSETLNVEEANVPFKSWPKAKNHSERRNFFSEQRRSYQLPEYGQSQKPASVAISTDNIISVAVQGPIGVFSHTKPDGIIYFDLWDAFQSGRYGFQPKLNICALPNNEFLVQESVTNQMMVLRPEGESSYRLSPSSWDVNLQRPFVGFCRFL